jgi:membrane-bound ClpP family serine protease
MVLYTFAVVFAIIGLLLMIVSFLSDDTLGTRMWGMLLLIASAVTCLLKYYLANPKPVNDFFRSIFSR